jgi:chorismate mutase
MELDQIRKEISDVDLEILSLMKKRLELARMVGENKAISGDAVRNIPSENRVIDRYRGFALENRMNPVYSEAVCKILMQESIDLQASLPRKASSPRHIAIIGGCGKMGPHHRPGRWKIYGGSGRSGISHHYQPGSP